MRPIFQKPGVAALISALMASVPGMISAQQQETPPAPPAPIVVQGTSLPDAPVAVADMAKGPEIKGIISARSGDKIRVAVADGSSSVIAINDATKIRNKGGIFSSRNKVAADSLLNGLPVTVKTLQAGDQLVASQINLQSKDLKTANMIRTGTAQGFSEQTAATAALRGRMGDIDEYNVKGTTNVNFDTGKAVISEQAKAELCTTVNAAGGMKNALILVVGYTDSVGSYEYNQQLSEKRASRVVNHIQQSCGWKPYRMLTPTGMAEADPLASNDTLEGKAQNRRVSVNILVSKGLDGL